MWPMSTRYQKHDTGARLISNDGFLMGYVKVKCRKWNENSAGSIPSSLKPNRSLM